jgi:hypothetical protein
MISRVENFGSSVWAREDRGKQNSIEVVARKLQYKVYEKASPGWMDRHVIPAVTKNIRDTLQVGYPTVSEVRRCCAESLNNNNRFDVHGIPSEILSLVGECRPCTDVANSSKSIDIRVPLLSVDEAVVHSAA